MQNKSRKRKYINERTRRELNVITITDCLSHSSYFMAIFAYSNWDAFRCCSNGVGFGQIHILTLVIGTSLVGVLIDFPLHWLAGSFLTENGYHFLRCKIAFYVFISLLVTLLGYGLLAFTHLPILQQTALFFGCILDYRITCDTVILTLFILSVSANNIITRKKNI